MAPPDGRGQEMTSRLLKSMWSLQAGVEGTLFHVQSQQLWGFPGGAVIKNPPAMQETQEVWVLALGREDPLEEECNPLQYSCLENPVDRGVWWAVVWGHTELVVVQQL